VYQCASIERSIHIILIGFNILSCTKLEELLIELEKQHEVLFDINSVKYRDQHVRNEAWEEIAREMNLSGLYFIFCSSNTIVEF
jgi:hypothetical protein